MPLPVHTRRLLQLQLGSHAPANAPRPLHCCLCVSHTLPLLLERLPLLLQTLCCRLKIAALLLQRRCPGLHLVPLLLQGVLCSSQCPLLGLRRRLLR